MPGKLKRASQKAGGRRPLRVLLAPDKFKGTLSAAKVARAIARGWARARPQDRLELQPITDGGDGFGEVMSELLRARTQTVRTVDAAHRRCRALWWWQAKTRTAIIESAKVIGLARLPAGRFHPFELDTFGLGAVLRAAAAKGARRCIIGVGGSATNDGGFGLARALGWQFLDRAGKPIAQWSELDQLTELRAPPRRRLFPQLLVALDVDNRLLGLRGATRIYGPQKGLRLQDFKIAENCLARMAKVVAGLRRRDLAQLAGAGAAGGLGFGLFAFLQGRPARGFEVFARMSRLDTKLRAADCVLTGEGALDRSTLMGKGVGQLAARCRRLGIPCLALTGTLSASAALRNRFSGAWALTDLTSLGQAKAEPARWLELLATRIARGYGLRSAAPRPGKFQ